MSINTANNPRVVVAVAILLFVVGAGLTAYGVSEYRAQSQVIDDVDEVEATIVSVDLEAYENGEQSNIRRDRWEEHEADLTWHLAVEFEYEYAGEPYRSTKFDAAGGVPTYSDWDDARDARDNYQEGDRVTAYVPADEPSEAFFEEGMPTLVYGTIGFGILLLLGAIWVPIAHRFGIGQH